MTTQLPTDTNAQQIDYEWVFLEMRCICGERNVFRDSTTIAPYGRDNTLDLSFDFDILVKPGTADEVSKIMFFCNRHRVSVTPRGAGTGVTGGALPVCRGIVLSTERLNRIISVDTLDGIAIAEAGVITSVLKAAVESAGFFFPVTPTSADSSFVGGNVAGNAGSMYSCRYGMTGDYVINLQVVLPTGELVWTGANVLKNSTGLNLTRLMVGSEGTLAVITKVVYRILKTPEARRVILAAFDNLDLAWEALKILKQSRFTPDAAELLCKSALNLVSKLTDVHINPNGEAVILIIEFSGETTRLNEFLHFLSDSFDTLISQPLLVGETRKEMERIWHIRTIGLAMSSQGKFYRDIDVAIPFSRLLDYIKFVESLADESEVTIVIFGHAFDGNLHTMILLEKNSNTSNQRLELLADRIYRFSINIGGVISGEHGIGMLQREFMKIQFDGSILGIMSRIKYAFDPNGILNPYKMFEK